MIGGRLYRDVDCMFPARCQGVEHFLRKLLHKLPETQFVLNTRDWPQVFSYQSQLLPVFSFSKVGLCDRRPAVPRCGLYVPSSPQISVFFQALVRVKSLPVRATPGLANLAIALLSHQELQPKLYSINRGLLKQNIACTSYKIAIVVSLNTC